MELAFWDSSSLVPLCVQQQPSGKVHKLRAKYGFVVWWSTQVELQAAFARLLRADELTRAEYLGAIKSLEMLRRGWRELQPTENLRTRAEALVDRFPLKAADALQLGAAMVWCLDNPVGRKFISGDKQLLHAAGQLGFDLIET
jgi:predicted nucleic acid-binding protein